jgi:ferredoxin
VVKNWALPEINLAVCTLCGACVVGCPTEAVEMGPEGPFIARPADCTYCISCEELCPEGAISCPFEIVWQDTE